MTMVSFSFSQCNNGIGLVGTMEAIKSMDPSEGISWVPLDVVTFSTISSVRRRRETESYTKGNM